MTAITRTFAGFLSLLFVFVALSLAGSWHLRHHLSPEAAVAAPACGAQMPGGDLEQRQARISEVRELRFWTTAAQVASLLLCAMVCGIGLYLRYRAAHEARGKEEAERELDRERRALERRVEERTRELRQEVEDRRRAEELNRGQKQVLEMLAAPGQQTTEDILLHLVETVAAQRRSWECSLHLVDLGGKTLQLMASSEVSERLKRYLGSIGTDFPDAPEGRACLSGQTCIVPAMTEVRRPWSELLVANGIFTAWSVPFRTHVSDHVTGTLTVYSRLLGTPSDRDLELVETAAKMAALVIEHRRIHAELVHNAYQDVLTGLPNRRAGEESIQAAISHAALCSETVAVLWIDLNRFKRINDQYGHSAGDHVLRTVANRLRRSPLISGGSARMGGDEFLVLLSGKEAPARAGDISRELGAAIAEPINLGTSTVCVTASIGICSYPHDGTAIDILERNADFAMYRAKSDGAGSCIYSPAMSEEVNEALELEQALVIALEQDQFRLAYQPLYGQDGELFGFEALLRFQHPTLGNISPARFVPVAEETRLILPIGTWVLREACRQLKEWHDAGLPHVRMGVNISALQFVRDDFAETVAEVLATFGLSPEDLTLELTESVVMEDYASVVRQMNLLKECGVRISMDDFGTGYSSLSYIHKLPIDTVKIDRSFIERLAEPDGTRPIVEAVIAMARHLGLSTVAEGVETAEQQHILRQAGCHGLQGFLFARPLPPEEAKRCLMASSTTAFANPQLRPVTKGIAVA